MTAKGRCTEWGLAFFEWVWVWVLASRTPVGKRSCDQVACLDANAALAGRCGIPRLKSAAMQAYFKLVRPYEGLPRIMQPSITSESGYVFGTYSDRA